MFTGMSANDVGMLMTGAAAIGYVLVVDRLPHRWRLVYALLLFICACLTFQAGILLGGFDL